jgi:putative peptide zinc metalloprotease protein
MKRKNILTSLAIAGSILAFIAWFPLPFSVKCAFEIQPQDALQVRAMVPGHLVAWNKRPGEPVREGETIAKLDNVDLAVQEAKYQNEYDLAKVRLKTMKQQINSAPKQDSMLLAQEEVLASAANLLQQVQSKRAQLLVRSPRDGIIIEPPSKPVAKAAIAEGQLPSWSGNPFASVNSQAFYSEGDVLCVVGEPTEMEAVIVVDQSDVDLIKIGDEVELMLDSARLNSVTGKISRIAESEMKETPENLAIQSGGQLNTAQDESGKVRPISTSYQATVPLDPRHVPFRSSYRGKARVHLEWRSLGWRFYRFCLKTFNFDF